MSADTVFRSEYRDHIIEITLSEEPGRRWQGDWAVFEKEPLVAIGAGVLAIPGKTRAAAQAAAWRSASLWADAYIGGADAHIAASQGKKS